MARMKILFITSSRLGDGVLSTGLLDDLQTQYPEAQITVACGPLVAGMFEQAPQVIRVIAMKKRPYARHWLDLWRDVSGTRWDMVVDLRNSIVSRFIKAKRRYIWSSNIDKNLHKVEQNAAVMQLDNPPSPKLWFDEGLQDRAKDIVPSGLPVLAVGPSANWIGKTWPQEYFIELIARLTGKGGILPDVPVVVLAAPGEEDQARPVLESLPPARQIDAIATYDPVTAAAIIQRCVLYIGNDSGLMHCAAASGTSTLGLFGPTNPGHYRPWGHNAAYVSTPEDWLDLAGYKGFDSTAVTGSLMSSLTVDMAAQAAEVFWKEQNNLRDQAEQA